MTSSDSRTAIVFVISNLEYGGAQRQLVELSNNLNHDLYDVHICSLSSYVPLAADLDRERSTLHIIEKRYKFDVSVVWRLARLLRSLNTVIVQSYLFDAEIAARLASTIAGTPLMVCSERNTNYKLKRKQLLAHLLTKPLYDACIANSHDGARFNSKLYGQPMSMYHVVRNGVNMERFRPRQETALRRSLGISDDDFCIGMFGSFKAQKNHPMLLRAMHLLVEKHANARLLLVGDQLHKGMHGSTAYKLEIDALITELGLAAHCILAGNRDDVERLYNVCDVSVLPSLFEGTPNVALESLASGTPVIATDVSDNRDIIPEGEVGFVVPLHDHQLLAKRLSEFVESPDTLAAMRERSREWAVETFSTQDLARRTEGVFESLLASQ